MSVASFCLDALAMAPARDRAVGLTASARAPPMRSVCGACTMRHDRMSAVDEREIADFIFSERGDCCEVLPMIQRRVTQAIADGGRGGVREHYPCLYSSKENPGLDALQSRRPYT